MRDKILHLRRGVLVSVTLMLVGLASAADDVTLTKEEAEFLKTIMTRDKMLRALPVGQSSLSALNTVMTAVVSGPVTLALRWNQVAIKGWREANKKLVEIEKGTICRDIELQILDS